MKKIILLALSAITILAGCDLERFPYDAYASEEVQSDPESKADVLLNGCYSYIRSVEETTVRLGEYRGDHVRKDKPTTAAYRIFYLFDRVPDNTEVDGYWKNCYKIISQASEIIKMIPEGQSDEIDHQIGEAYFLRGWMYWNLSKMFGRPYYQDPEKNLSVPIVNGIPEDLKDYELPDRSTVKEVYEFAIKDLEKAESLLNTFSPIKASKEATWAILSKMYAHMSGTFENPNATYAQLSLNYADKVIKSGQFHLLDRNTFMTSNEMTPENAAHTEVIFACKLRFEDRPKSGDQAGLLGGQYARIKEVGWGETGVSSIAIDLLNEVGTNDWRNGPGNTDGIIDARAAWVVPDYSKNADGSLKRAFIFVANQYDASGTHNGFNTLTFDAESTSSDGQLLSVKASDGTVYNLTPVDVENRKYSISYKGDTYVGYDDARMSENQSHPNYYNYKLSMEGGGNFGVQTHSIRVATLSDVYLLRAEANAKLGNYGEALTDLNLIRERSLPGHSYESLNASNAGDLILKERALEMMFTGNRVFDLFRNGRTLQRAFPGWQTDPLRIIQPTDNDIVMYIPTQQIQAWRGTLTQNP